MFLVLEPVWAKPTWQTSKQSKNADKVYFIGCSITFEWANISEISDIQILAGGVKAIGPSLEGPTKNTTLLSQSISEGDGG
jgi:hypothetical protein